MRQSEMASRLSISTSYMSQLENDDRPLTPTLVERVSRVFPLDWHRLDAGDTEVRLAALREANADPIFEDPFDAGQLARFCEQQPALSQRFVALHEAYRQSQQRLQMADEAISVDTGGGGRLPWEEVRDWFHLSNNYIDSLDCAAEALSQKMNGLSPNLESIEEYLQEIHLVDIIYNGDEGIRYYDNHSGRLVIDPGQPAQTQRFQLAHQLVALALAEEISDVVNSAKLLNPASRQLLSVGLSNYAAGALLMPYTAFRLEARRLQHDIDRLGQTFGVSFEQACHRLSTLQRPKLRGVPFFFCRVDMAGNITKRHSATRLQFARFGGACPLWIVHEAVAIPDRILVQLAETPDGLRYISMAKGLVKPSGCYDRLPRRYAVALGCEAEYADEFIYAQGLDLSGTRSATKIGISCRICPRSDCDQRAFPPSDRMIQVNPNQRGLVPYQIEKANT